MTIKTFLIISIGVSIILLLLINGDCYIQFDPQSEVTSLVLQFGILAIIVERISNAIFLRNENTEIKEFYRTKFLLSKNLIKNDTKTDMVDILKKEKSRNEDFNWYSFAIGLLIASFGFRFFIQVSHPIGNNCKEYIPYLFTIIDVIMTAILISGGSNLIDNIVGRIDSDKMGTI